MSKTIHDVIAEVAKEEANKAYDEASATGNWQKDQEGNWWFSIGVKAFARDEFDIESSDSAGVMRDMMGQV